MPALPSLWPARLVAALPNACAVCRAGTRGREGRLCAACVARWAAVRPRCTTCALIVPAGIQTCGVCLRDAPVLGMALAATDYAYPFDGLLSAFKFHDALDLAPALAGLLHRAWQAGGSPRVDALLPVPLSAARLRERGYNQAAVLAQTLSRRVAAPVLTRTVLRVIDTPQQTTLDRDHRLASLRGAFAVEPAAQPALQGLRVALIDDVMTTGATLNELANTLLRAGSGPVQAWVVARTPP